MQPISPRKHFKYLASECPRSKTPHTEGHTRIWSDWTPRRGRAFSLLPSAKTQKGYNSKSNFLSLAPLITLCWENLSKIEIKLNVGDSNQDEPPAFSSEVSLRIHSRFETFFQTWNVFNYTSIHSNHFIVCSQLAIKEWQANIAPHYYVPSAASCSTTRS